MASKRIPVNFRSLRDNPDEEECLKRDLALILANKTQSMKFEFVFGRVHNITMTSRVAQVYADAKDIMRKYVQERILPGIQEHCGKPDLLSALASTHRNFCNTKNILHFVLTRVVQCVPGAVGADVEYARYFEQIVLLNPQVSQALTRFLLSELEEARTEQGLDSERVSLLKTTCRDVLWGISTDDKHTTYERLMEAPYLEAARNYFEVFINDSAAHKLGPDCVRSISHMIDSESDRLERLLGLKQTADKAHRLALGELEKHLGQIATTDNHNFAEMLRARETDNLHDIYALFKQTNGGIGCLQEEIRKYITGVAQAMVGPLEEKKEYKPAEACDFVGRLLQLRSDMLDAQQECFEKNGDMLHSIMEALDHVVNNKKVEIGPMLAAYLDYIICGVDDKQESDIDAIMSLFELLKNKDTLERAHLKGLRRRLLTREKGEHDLEKAVLLKLRDRGTDIAGMRKMIEETEKAGDLNKRFASWYAEKQTGTKPPFTLEVTVLQSTNWIGDFSMRPCVLPSPAREMFDVFASGFYRQLQPKHRLTLLPRYGTATLRMRLNGCNVLLNAQTVQMMVLLLFNKTRCLHPRAITDELKVEEVCVIDAIRKLGAVKVLVKNKQNLGIMPNSKFASTKSKIDCYPTKSASKIESKEQAKELEEWRKHVTQANIVRVMKARQSLPFERITGELHELPNQRFSPERRMVKQCIESLIEQGILVRDEDNMNLYHYQA